VIAPGATGAPRAIVAANKRRQVVAAGIDIQARADRIAEIVIEL